MNKSPCLDCKNRSLYCHDTCKRYLKYRKLIDEARVERVKEMDVMGYTINNVYKFKKARNLAGGRI